MRLGQILVEIISLGSIIEPLCCFGEFYAPAGFIVFASGVNFQVKLDGTGLVSSLFDGLFKSGGSWSHVGAFFSSGV